MHSLSVGPRFGSCSTCCDCGLLVARPGLRTGLSAMKKNEMQCKLYSLSLSAERVKSEGELNLWRRQLCRPSYSCNGRDIARGLLFSFARDRTHLSAIEKFEFAL